MNRKSERERVGIKYTNEDKTIHNLATQLAITLTDLQLSASYIQMFKPVLSSNGLNVRE